MFAAVKHLHIACVILSGTGFFLRGALMAANVPLPRSLKWVPHVIDSVLLATAVTLVVLSRQYPFVDAWVTAKVLALPLYIILGSVALAPRRPRPVRIAAWLGAMAVFGNIVAVALTKNPFGLFRLLGG